MFALTQQNASTSDQVAIGTIPVDSINAHVLFDYDSSYSFASPKFITSLNSISEELNKPLYVATYLKKVFPIDILFKNCIT